MMKILKLTIFCRLIELRYIIKSDILYLLLWAVTTLLLLSSSFFLANIVIMILTDMSFSISIFSDITYGGSILYQHISMCFGDKLYALICISYCFCLYDINLILSLKISLIKKTFIRVICIQIILICAALVVTHYNICDPSYISIVWLFIICGYILYSLLHMPLNKKNIAEFLFKFVIILIIRSLISLVLSLISLTFVLIMDPNSGPSTDHQGSVGNSGGSGGQGGGPEQPDKVAIAKYFKDKNKLTKEKPSDSKPLPRDPSDNSVGGVSDTSEDIKEKAVSDFKKYHILKKQNSFVADEMVDNLIRENSDLKLKALRSKANTIKVGIDTTYKFK